MTKTFNEMAYSLKDYIQDVQSASKQKISFSASRYNNLKLSMNRKKESRPHVTVRIGMSEATFAIPSGEKISGGLGMDESLVLRWLSRDLIMPELDAMWKAKANAKIDLTKREDEDDD